MYFNTLFYPHVFLQIFLTNNFQFLNTHQSGLKYSILWIYGPKNEDKAMSKSADWENKDGNERDRLVVEDKML